MVISPVWQHRDLSRFLYLPPDNRRFKQLTNCWAQVDDLYLSLITNLVVSFSRRR